MPMLKFSSRTGGALPSGWLLCAVWTLSVVAPFGSANVRSGEPPNIVLILADDVGREVLGCYGGQSYSTPRIDRLAGEGVRLEHCYVMPACHPTRISLLTGLYPFRMNNPKWGSFPRDMEKHTIAQRLKRAGYATAIAGKWQLTLLGSDLKHPNRLGFDEYCLFGWHEGPRYFRPLIWQNGASLEGVAERYGPDLYCDYLIDFMGRNRERPFFAYYSMALCHDVTDDLPTPVPVGPAGRYESYSEMVASMDRQVGRLLDAIDRLQIRDRTLVMFLTDNGTPARYIASVKQGKLVRRSFTSRWQGADIRGGKTKLTDLGIRVPGMIRWPGHVRAGEVSKAMFDVTDVLPTLVRAAAGPPRRARDSDSGQDVNTAAPAIDGRPWAPLFPGSDQRTREWIFAQRGGEACVRTTKWKLYTTGRLFDMESDPFEKGEGNPGAPAVRSDLSAAFDRTRLPAIQETAVSDRDALHRQGDLLHSAGGRRSGRPRGSLPEIRGVQSVDGTGGRPVVGDLPIL